MIFTWILIVLCLACGIGGAVCSMALCGLLFWHLYYTEDAVEVVRCKDCRHRYEEGDCTHYYWCRINDRPIDDTDFCAWGELKGGDTE